MVSRWPPWIRAAGRFALERRARSDAVHEWRRRLRGEPQLPPGRIRSVLVICHGNICRSPFAAALLAARVSELSVRSAGLAAGAGNPAEAGARAAAAAYGIHLDEHRSQPLDESLVASADLILAMEGHQLGALARRFSGARGRTRLLGDFLARPPHRIPDPWGCEEVVFRRTFAQIAAAVGRLGERIGAHGASAGPSAARNPARQAPGSADGSGS